MFAKHACQKWYRGFESPLHRGLIAHLLVYQVDGFFIFNTLSNDQVSKAIIDQLPTFRP